MTYIEVLDTAVKIGLGAAISGIATYLATRLKGKQDSKNEFEKYKRSMLERISLGFEESISTLTRVVLLLSEASSAPKDAVHASLIEASDLRMKWYEQINGTEALATLVGSSLLMEKLSSYSDLAARMLAELATPDWDSLNEQVERINSTRDEVRAAIRSAFAECAF